MFKHLDGFANQVPIVDLDTDGIMDLESNVAKFHLTFRQKLSVIDMESVFWKLWPAS